MGEDSPVDSEGDIEPGSWPAGEGGDDRLDEGGVMSPASSVTKAWRLPLEGLAATKAWRSTLEGLAARGRDLCSGDESPES
jgi:hypothetical protein